MKPVIKKNLLLFIVIVAFLPSTTLLGQDDNMQWHGFMSTGSRYSDQDVTYLGGVTEDASFVSEYKVGLNLNYRISHELSFAMQFLAKPDGEKSQVSNDWAFATYRPINEAAIRFGKQKFPLGLISEYPDVGFAYPWIRPPGEVYGLAPLKSVYGGEAEYGFEFDDSTLSLKILGGETHEEIDSGFSSTQTVHAKKLMGAIAIFDSNETKFKAGYLSALTDVNTDVLIEDLQVTFITLGAKYESSGLLLQMEYTDVDGEVKQETIDRTKKEADTATSQGDSDTAANKTLIATLMEQPLSDYKGWFITAGYRYKRLLPHFTTASLKAPSDSYGFQSQTSNALGLKYNFTDNSDIKLEFKQIKFPDGECGLVEVASYAKSSKPKTLNIYSLGFDLVF